VLVGAGWQDICTQFHRVNPFLSTLSHELRTPLNAVLGWSQLLLDGRLDGAAARKALEAVNRNATAQVRLVEDVLDVSRIVSGMLRLEIRRVQLAECLDAALAAVGPAAAARQIEIALSVDRSVVVFGDADRLQQVLWNLLSNGARRKSPGHRTAQTHGSRDISFSSRSSVSGSVGLVRWRSNPASRVRR
jgi:signal transduction histidine kinase